VARQIDFSKPLNPDEAEYVLHRPWLIQDAELQGIEIRYESDEFETEGQEESEEEDLDESDAEEDVEDEEDAEEDVEDESDGYDDLDYEELKALAKSRSLSASGSRQKIADRLRAADEVSE